MKEKIIEKLVLDNFGEPYRITRHRNGKAEVILRYDIRVKGVPKQISANSREKLMQKMYEFMNSPEPVDTSLRAVFYRYYAYREESAAIKAISSQTASYDMSNWIRFFDSNPIADMDIKKITPTHLYRAYAEIVGDQQFTKKQFNKAISLMSGIFDQGIFEGIITSNVTKSVQTKRLKFALPTDLSVNDGNLLKDREVYTTEEIKALRAYIRTLEPTIYTRAILLATYLILRIGELRALTWEDYSRENRTLRIHHEIIQVKKNGKERSDEDVPYTKGHQSEGIRIVCVPLEAVTILEELRSINGNKKYILQGSNGAKFSIPQNKFNEHLRMYCKGAGIKYLSSHKFRFYGISLRYEKGVDERDIQYEAGHSTPNTTRHYNRFTRKGPDCETIDKLFES